MPGAGSPLLGRLSALDASSPQGFEGLVRDALAEVTGQRFDLASSGRQGGVDALSRGNAACVGMEAKRYRESTHLGIDELKAKIVDAASSYPSLDVWILATPRELPLQHAEALAAQGTGLGIRVVVLDSRAGPGGLDGVAVLLAAAPRTCGAWFAGEAAVLAAVAAVRAAPGFPGAEAQLRDRLRGADLGWDAARRAMAAWLRESMAEQARSRARLDTFAELLAPATRLLDRPVNGFLDGVLSAPGVPRAVVGPEGHGKTWAVLKWWNERAGADGTGLPLTVVLPARDVRGDDLEALVAAALASRTGVGDEAYWRLRLGRWRRGGTAALLVILDGLNQVRVPVRWGDLVRPLVSDGWAGRASVVFTVRPTEWGRLNRLADVAPAPLEYELGPYTDEQLDGLLRSAGLDRGTFDPRLPALMKVPRLFALAVGRAQDPIRITELTPEALALEEYRHRLRLHGREQLPLGEEGFRSLVARLGQGFRDAVAEAREQVITRRELVAEISLESGDGSGPGLDAMVSELASGRWLEERGENRFALDTRAVPLALGLALVAEAQRDARPPEAFLAEFLDVFRGSDLGAKVVRAACAVALLQEDVGDDLRRQLLLAWVTAQGFTDDHFQTFWRLACFAPGPVADFAEGVWRERRWGQDLDEILAKGLAQAAKHDAVGRDAVIARLERWLGTWWPDHLEGRMLGRASEIPGGEGRRAEVLARTTDWAWGVGPRLARPPALNAVPSEDGWAWVARRAMVTLSYMPRAPAVAALRSWAAAGAILRWPSSWDEGAWVLRWNDLDAGAAADAVLAAAREFLEAGHPLATTAAGFLLHALATSEAASLLALAEGDARHVRDRREPDLASFWGLKALDGIRPADWETDGDLAAGVQAVWDGDRLREVLPTLSVRDAAELLALLARWAPARVPGAVDALVNFAATLDAEGFGQLVGLACTMPLLFGPDARRRLLDAPAALSPEASERLAEALLVLRLIDANGEGQFALLADAAGVPLRRPFSAVLDRIPAEPLERRLRAALASGDADELSRILHVACRVQATAPPAEDTVLLDLTQHGDVRVRALAMRTLRNADVRGLAVAFADGGWTWRPGLDRHEAAYGSLLLLAASRAGRPDALERADPQVASFAYRDDADQADRFAAWVEAQVKRVRSPPPEGLSTASEWADNGPEIRRLAQERPDDAERWLRRLAGSGMRSSLIMFSPLIGLLGGLMRADPDRAAALWRDAIAWAGSSVRSEELETMPFAVPAEGVVRDLRREALDRARDDARLAEIAFRATANPEDDWIVAAVLEDLHGASAATVARGLTLAGYGRTHGPLERLWASELAGPPAPGWLADVHRRAAAEFARHRRALALGRAFATAPSDAEAAVAFLRFQRAFDLRAVEMVVGDVNAGRLAMSDTRRAQWALGGPDREARLSLLRREREETFGGTRRERGMHPWR
jgi:hypothetical protein